MNHHAILNSLHNSSNWRAHADIAGSFPFGALVHPFLFCNHLAEDERADFLTSIVFLILYNCKFSVDRLQRTVSWSAVCICGIAGHTQ